MNKTAVPLANTVDGKTGHQEILKMWKDHFQPLFNCVENIKNTYSRTEKDMPYTKECVISLFEVENAIKNLKQNKSCGKDELYAEHLQLGSPKIGVLLSIIFTSFLVHGYLPDTFMDIVLVPVIKDKTGKLSDKDNYRPIALASVISKVFERIMFDKISRYLDVEPNQYGFKKKSGTDLCIYALKEIEDTYKVLNGSVFMVYILVHDTNNFCTMGR